MKTPAYFTMPWDMVVFLTITSVGFGFSVQKLRQPKFNESFQITQTAGAEATGGVDAAGQITVDLGCLERKVSRERITSQDGAIRIKGRFCHMTSKAMRAFDGMRVRNTSNGSEGTIFFQGFDGSFVTDYVTLKSGKNIIEVEWREAQGATPKQYVAEVLNK